MDWSKARFQAGRPIRRLQQERDYEGLNWVVAWQIRLRENC